MRSLKEFIDPRQVFKTPTALPPFFDENLVDPARVVMEFLDDPQAHIRVFYYQYLKLCFEVNSPNSEALVQKIEELINNSTFRFIFYQEDDPTIYNDTQAKRLISEFFGVLSSGEITVLQAINTYPIMDVVMVHFFRTLMLLMDKAQSLDNFIPRDDLLSFLCGFFGIQVELHDSCIKYVDTDVFVYDYSDRAVYMAYINYSDDPTVNAGVNYQNDEVEAFQAPKATPEQIPISKNVTSNVAPPIDSKDTSSKGAVKQSYIASQFYDYTQDNLVSKLADKGTTLKGSGHFLNSQVQDVKTTLVEQKSTHIALEQEHKTTTFGSGFEDHFQQTKHHSIHQPTTQVDYFAKITNASGLPQTVSPPPTPAQVGSTNQLYQPSAFIPSVKPVTPVISPAPPTPYVPPKPSNPYQSYQINVQPLAPSPKKEPSPIKAVVNEPIPTKDCYGYTQINQTSSTFTVQTVSNQVPPPSQVPLYSAPPPKDLNYNPKQSPIYNTKADTQLYGAAPKTDIADFKYSGVTNQVKVTTQVSANMTMGATSSNGVAGSKKKNNFGLNVSQQFTNSFTIKSIAEPFKTNVVNIKTRARNFRTSLVNYFK